MEKEKFLNLVKDAYQNAVDLRDKSKQKIEYLEQVNEINILSDEYKKAESEYKLACLNIERLKSMLNLPMYEKILAFSKDRIEEYKLDKINNVNLEIKTLELNLSDYEKELAELKKKQEDNVSQYSNETDDEKKEQIINEGKELQESYGILEENISKIKEKIGELKSYITTLKEMSVEEIKEQIKKDAGLNDRDYNDYSRNDSIIRPIVDDKVKLRELLSLLYKYDKVSTSVEGYSLELNHYLVKVLDFLNNEKEMIRDNKLYVADFNDIYRVKNSIPSSLESIQDDSKRVDKDNKSFFSKASLIGDNLAKAKNTPISDFCDLINDIIKVFPDLSRIVRSDLEELKSYDNFFTKTFQQSKIQEMEYSIQNKAYDWFANVLNSYLATLKRKLEFIGYSNERFILYLGESIDRLSKVNGNLVIQNVLEEMPKIQKEYSYLNEKLTLLCNDIEENNKLLTVRLDRKKTELEEINKDINTLLGEKISSSEIERLIRVYGNAPLEQTISDIEISQLRDDVYRAAYSQNMSVEELTNISIENETESKSL